MLNINKVKTTFQQFSQLINLHHYPKPPYGGSQEVRWLLEHIHNHLKLTDNFQVHGVLSMMVNKRCYANQPLQYILGNQPFGELDIIVQEPVLIPRPETEAWVYKLAQIINKHKCEYELKILDICTGSGCIPLSLSNLVNHPATFYGLDISSEAISLSRRNQIHNTNILKHPVEFFKGDIFDDIFVKDLISNKGPFDIIISNPPYIPPVEYQKLEPSVKDWEDIKALRTKDDKGLEFYTRIIYLIKQLNILSEMKKSNVPNVVFEIGNRTQGNEIILDLERAGLKAEMHLDVFNSPRVVYGLLRSNS